MAVNTIANLPIQNKKFYDRTLLERLLPTLVFYKDALKKKIPKKQGNTISFRQLEGFDPALTPLTEGVTPTGQDLAWLEITATLKQYGDWVAHSDLLDLIGIDPNITEASEALGEQAGLTVDTLIRDIICAGTNVHYAGGALTRNALTQANIITADEVRRVVRTLRRNNIKPFEDGYYHAAIDADTSYDLMREGTTGGWIDVHKYTHRMPLLKGELGTLGGVRFYETSNLSVVDNASGVAIHQCPVYGKNAYATVDIGGGVAKPGILVKPLGSAGTADPLNQRGSIGWKINQFTAVRLNELKIVRLECAATL